MKLTLKNIRLICNLKCLNVSVNLILKHVNMGEKFIYIYIILKLLLQINMRVKFMSQRCGLDIAEI